MELHLPSMGVKHPLAARTPEEYRSWLDKLIITVNKGQQYLSSTTNSLRDQLEKEGDKTNPTSVADARKPSTMDQLPTRHALPNRETFSANLPTPEKYGNAQSRGLRTEVISPIPLEKHFAPESLLSQNYPQFQGEIPSLSYAADNTSPMKSSETPGLDSNLSPPPPPPFSLLKEGTAPTRVSPGSPYRYSVDFHAMPSLVNSVFHTASIGEKSRFSAEDEESRRTIEANLQWREKKGLTPSPNRQTRNIIGNAASLQFDYQFEEPRHVREAERHTGPTVQSPRFLERLNNIPRTFEASATETRYPSSQPTYAQGDSSPHNSISLLTASSTVPELTTITISAINGNKTVSRTPLSSQRAYTIQIPSPTKASALQPHRLSFSPQYESRQTAMSPKEGPAASSYPSSFASPKAQSSNVPLVSVHPMLHGPAAFASPHSSTSESSPSKSSVFCPHCSPQKVYYSPSAYSSHGRYTCTSSTCPTNPAHSANSASRVSVPNGNMAHERVGTMGPAFDSGHLSPTSKQAGPKIAVRQTQKQLAREARIKGRWGLPGNKPSNSNSPSAYKLGSPSGAENKYTIRSPGKRGISESEFNSHADAKNQGGTAYPYSKPPKNPTEAIEWIIPAVEEEKTLSDYVDTAIVLEPLLSKIFTHYLHSQIAIAHNIPFDFGRLSTLDNDKEKSFQELYDSRGIPAMKDTLRWESVLRFFVDLDIISIYSSAIDGHVTLPVLTAAFHRCMAEDPLESGMSPSLALMKGLEFKDFTVLCALLAVLCCGTVITRKRNSPCALSTFFSEYIRPYLHKWGMNDAQQESYLSKSNAAVNRTSPFRPQKISASIQVTVPSELIPSVNFSSFGGQNPQLSPSQYMDNEVDGEGELSSNLSPFHKEYHLEKRRQRYSSSFGQNDAYSEDDGSWVQTAPGPINPMFQPPSASSVFAPAVDASVEPSSSATSFRDTNAYISEYKTTLSPTFAAHASGARATITSDSAHSDRSLRTKSRSIFATSPEQGSPTSVATSRRSPRSPTASGTGLPLRSTSRTHERSANSRAVDTLSADKSALRKKVSSAVEPSVRPPPLNGNISAQTAYATAKGNAQSPSDDHRRGHVEAEAPKMRKEQEKQRFYGKPESVETDANIVAEEKKERRSGLLDVHRPLEKPSRKYSSDATHSAGNHVNDQFPHISEPVLDENREISLKEEWDPTLDAAAIASWTQLSEQQNSLLYERAPKVKESREESEDSDTTLSELTDRVRNMKLSPSLQRYASKGRRHSNTSDFSDEHRNAQGRRDSTTSNLSIGRSLMRTLPITLDISLSDAAIANKALVGNATGMKDATKSNMYPSDTTIEASAPSGPSNSVSTGRSQTPVLNTKPVKRVAKRDASRGKYQVQSSTSNSGVHSDAYVPSSASKDVDDDAHAHKEEKILTTADPESEKSTIGSSSRVRSPLGHVHSLPDSSSSTSRSAREFVPPTSSRVQPSELRGMDSYIHAFTDKILSRSMVDNMSQSNDAQPRPLADSRNEDVGASPRGNLRQKPNSVPPEIPVELLPELSSFGKPGFRNKQKALKNGADSKLKRKRNVHSPDAAQDPGVISSPSKRNTGPNRTVSSPAPGGKKLPLPRRPAPKRPMSPADKSRGDSLDGLTDRSLDESYSTIDKDLGTSADLTAGLSMPMHSSLRRASGTSTNFGLSEAMVAPNELDGQGTGTHLDMKNVEDDNVSRRLFSGEDPGRTSTLDTDETKRVGLTSFDDDAEGVNAEPIEENYQVALSEMTDTEAVTNTVMNFLRATEHNLSDGPKARRASTRLKAVSPRMQNSSTKKANYDSAASDEEEVAITANVTAQAKPNLNMNISTTPDNDEDESNQPTSPMDFNAVFEASSEDAVLTLESILEGNFMPGFEDQSPWHPESNNDRIHAQDNASTPSPHNTSNAAAGASTLYHAESLDETNSVSYLEPTEVPTTPVQQRSTPQVKNIKASHSTKGKSDRKKRLSLVEIDSIDVLGLPSQDSVKHDEPPVTRISFEDLSLDHHPQTQETVNEFDEDNESQDATVKVMTEEQSYDVLRNAEEKELISPKPALDIVDSFVSTPSVTATETIVPDASDLSVVQEGTSAKIPIQLAHVNSRTLQLDEPDLTDQYHVKPSRDIGLLDLQAITILVPSLTQYDSALKVPNVAGTLVGHHKALALLFAQYVLKRIRLARKKTGATLHNNIPSINDGWMQHLQYAKENYGTQILAETNALYYFDVHRFVEEFFVVPNFLSIEEAYAVLLSVLPTKVSADNKVPVDPIRMASFLELLARIGLAAFHHKSPNDPPGVAMTKLVRIIATGLIRMASA